MKETKNISIEFMCKNPLDSMSYKNKSIIEKQSQSLLQSCDKIKNENK